MSRRRGEEERHDTPTAMPEYERIVIGEALQNPDFFWRQVDRLRPEHFTLPRMGRIWAALMKATEKGRPPTKTWVPLFIDPADSREEVSLAIELAVLMNDLEEGREPDSFADTIYGLANKRAILDALVRTHNQIMKADVSTTADQMQAHAMSVLAKAIDQGHETHQRSYHGWAKKFYAKAEANVMAGEESQGIGLPCGLRAVEEVIGRLMPGKLYILAGMSGSGKSALARQIVEAAIDDAPGAAYIGSLEMTGEDYAVRAIAQRMGVSFENLERGQIDPAQLDVLYGHVESLKRKNIIIDDTPNQTIDQMIAHMKRIKITSGLSLAAIDHLLIVGAEKGESLFDKVTHATMKAKNAAKDLDIPIIMLAQLTEKKILETASGWPNTTHLFGGETITQNADAVAFVHRHELVLRKKEPDTAQEDRHAKWVKRMDGYRGKAHFFSDKRRGGASGTDTTREMRFLGEIMTFEDI